MVELREGDLREVLLVRAFEESDRACELLGQRERETATRDARAELSAEAPPVELIVTRARRLGARIARSTAGQERAAALAARPGPPLWVVLALALLLGVAVDRLGAGGRIDLLSFPILGLLLWNLGVALASFVSDLWTTKPGSRTEGAASRAAAEGRLARGLVWCLAPERPWRGVRAQKSLSGPVSQALQRYLRDFLRVGRPLHLSRARTRLHLFAAGVMLGAVAGMYLRGLVLHYEASWQSTFLTAEAVQRVLTLVFTPAAWVLQSPLPDVEAVEALRAPDGSGEAARWIHYYGVTGGLFVVLPRLALALACGRRSRRLERAVELDLEGDAYFLRLVATDRGHGQRALVQAYSYHPSARSSDGLSTLLYDVLGGRTRIERLEPCEYGDDPAPPPADLAGARLCRVVLFTLAQSPEDEVHGEYLARLLEGLRAQGGEAALLVLLDSGPMRERLPRGEEAGRRLAERERSWERVLRSVGLEAVVCELDGLADATVLERARVALHELGPEAAS